MDNFKQNVDTHQSSKFANHCGMLAVAILSSLWHKNSTKVYQSHREYLTHRPECNHVAQHPMSYQEERSEGYEERTYEKTQTHSTSHHKREVMPCIC